MFVLVEVSDKRGQLSAEKRKSGQELTDEERRGVLKHDCP